MLFKERAYLNFLLHSKNQYGIHSPFVFKLITQCFYDKTQLPTYKTLKSNRKKLNRKFGKQALKTTGLPPKKGKLLNRLVHYFTPASVLDYSDEYGLTANYLSVGSPAAVTSFFKEQKYFQSKLEGVDRVGFVLSNFEEWVKKGSSSFPDFIFIGQRQTQNRLLETYETLRPKISEDTLIIFQGIYQNPNSAEDWNDLKEQKEIRVTIDLFYWGLVFFKEDQAKQHFKIRV